MRWPATSVYYLEYSINLICKWLIISIIELIIDTGTILQWCFYMIPDSYMPSHPHPCVCHHPHAYINTLLSVGQLHSPCSQLHTVCAKFQIYILDSDSDQFVHLKTDTHGRTKNVLHKHMLILRHKHTGSGKWQLPNTQIRKRNTMSSQVVSLSLDCSEIHSDVHLALLAGSVLAVCHRVPPC